jgi:GNAT superfamily N-acetyltransferase
MREPLDVIEFGDLTDERRAELEGDEDDPFDSRRLGRTLAWRPKDHHVGLLDEDGRLIASVGWVLVRLDAGDREGIPVVGIGGVIVAAARRGQGLAKRVLEAALRRAERLGPEIAMLFCYPDRAGLYARHGFAEISPPVLVEQPAGQIEIPQVTMWHPLREGAVLPPGRVALIGLPF